VEILPAASFNYFTLLFSLTNRYTNAAVGQKPLSEILWDVYQENFNGVVAAKFQFVNISDENILTCVISETNAIIVISFMHLCLLLSLNSSLRHVSMHGQNDSGVRFKPQRCVAQCSPVIFLEKLQLTEYPQFCYTLTKSIRNRLDSLARNYQYTSLVNGLTL